MSINKIDDSVINKIANTLREYKLAEIEYKNGDEYLKLVANKTEYADSREMDIDGINESNIEPQKCAPSTNVASDQNTSVDENNTNVESSQGAINDYSNHPGLVRSPIIGTCYLAPSPDAEPFAQVGQDVKKGDAILIIEAMKVMNIIKAPKDGKLIYVAVENQAPIEYNQMLFVIE